MPDMTEWDQETYGAGYSLAEREIVKFGIDHCDAYVKQRKHFIDPSRKGGPDWFLTGYATCVNAWREGVRL